jgi:glycosyltransferase involved in cell wall biosynthesis
MHIAFVGCRNIPAKYGGLETFVEEISKRLIDKGFQVLVTCESDRFLEDTYKGVKRLHIPSFQSKYLTIPSLNDIIATLYLLLKHSKDIQMIYYVATDGVIAAFFAKLFKKKVVINADGIEWRRLQKRRRFVRFYWKPLYYIAQWYMSFVEAFSCKIADVMIADSFEIQKYLEKKYQTKNVVHIAYGARTLVSCDTILKDEESILRNYGLVANDYFLTVARIVPENNIDMEIKAFNKKVTTKKLIIVGNFIKRGPYTRYLYKLNGHNNVIFLDPIYDKKILGILRKNCYAYIHAYEVGGTNPSLLEQMTFMKPIIAYEVPFNREVLQDGGIFVRDADDLAQNISRLESNEFNIEVMKQVQQKRINENYNWDYVTEKYLELFRIFKR